MYFLQLISGILKPVLPTWVRVQSISATAGGVTTINLDNGYGLIVLGMGAGDTTINFTNPPAAGLVYHIPMEIIQDSTGGRTITAWQIGGSTTTERYPGGTLTLTATGNAVDHIHCILRNVGGTYTIDVKSAGLDMQ